MANANPHKPALVDVKRGELGLCGFMHSAKAVTFIAGVGLCRKHEQIISDISRTATPSKGRDVRHSKRLMLGTRP